MSNRPGRPSGGPPIAQRLNQYLALRARGLTYDEAAEAMNVSRAAICQYARRLRDAGELPPVPRSSPRLPAPPRPPSRCRAAVLEHLRRWPGVLFSAWELRRVLGSNVDWMLCKLVAEGVVEAVDGMRYPSDRRVPARRYRLGSHVPPAPAVQDATDAAAEGIDLSSATSAGLSRTSPEVRDGA